MTCLTAQEEYGGTRFNGNLGDLDLTCKRTEHTVSRADWHWHRRDCSAINDQPAIREGCLGDRLPGVRVADEQAHRFPCEAGESPDDRLLTRRLLRALRLRWDVCQREDSCDSAWRSHLPQCLIGWLPNAEKMFDGAKKGKALTGGAYCQKTGTCCDCTALCPTCIKVENLINICAPPTRFCKYGEPRPACRSSQINPIDVLQHIAAHQTDKIGLGNIVRRGGAAIADIERRGPGVGQAVSALVGGQAAEWYAGVWSARRIVLAGRFSASSGTVRYAIITPSWLTASSRLDTADTSGVVITLTVNPTATQLPPGTYRPHVAFRNVTNGHGSRDRIATLIVQPEAFCLMVQEDTCSTTN